MFAWRTALMPAPITYFNADTTIMHVAMPDGSDIWLTPGSTLCYDETFHTDERRVHLDGEAYFDVEHDAKHPFDVVTPNLRVRVLGTVFSVRSLRGDHMAETTLAEGAVSLQRADGSNLIRLHPGQRAIYDTQDEQLEIKEVPVGDHLALSYGIITLDGVPLRQIADRIEELYGVKLRLIDVSKSCGIPIPTESARRNRLRSLSATAPAREQEQTIAQTHTNFHTNNLITTHP